MVSTKPAVSTSLVTHVEDGRGYRPQGEKQVQRAAPVGPHPLRKATLMGLGGCLSPICGIVSEGTHIS